MAQQSIFGRISQLARANINALVDAAEDPQKMLDQMIRDYTANIREAEGAVAQTIGNVRLLEEDAREAAEAAHDWGRKALAASQRADQVRAEGNTSEAERFDNLARLALKRQLQFEAQVADMKPDIEMQNELVAKLKTGLEAMREKLAQLKRKRDELVARSRMAEAQSQVHDALKSVNVMDPTSEVSRFEEKIRREEARVRGQAELAASSLDAQFDDLEDVADDLEIEARLAQMKSE